MYPAVNELSNREKAKSKKGDPNRPNRTLQCHFVLWHRSLSFGWLQCLVLWIGEPVIRGDANIAKILLESYFSRVYVPTNTSPLLLVHDFLDIVIECAPDDVGSPALNGLALRITDLSEMDSSRLDLEKISETRWKYAGVIEMYIVNSLLFCAFVNYIILQISIHHFFVHLCGVGMCWKYSLCNLDGEWLGQCSRWQPIRKL